MLSAALAASAVAVNAKQAQAATKSTVTVSTGASVFDGYELANMTGRLLRPGETVTVQDTARDVSGNEWLNVGEGWIMSQWTDYDLADVNSRNTQTAQTQTAQQTEAYKTPKKTEKKKKAKVDTPVKIKTQTNTAKLPEEKLSQNTAQSNAQSSQNTAQSQSPVQSSTQYTAQSSAVKPNAQSQTKTNTATSQAPTSNAAKEWIAQRESGGSYTARNGRYYGRYQLDSSYLKGNYSAANQEKVADNYVANRYGSWENAKAHWLSHGWY